MHKMVFGVAIFGFASVAQAASPLFQNANFIPAEEGIKNLVLPLQEMSATPLLNVEASNGALTDRCSSSVVSDSGTLLTAGHCVDVCLEKAGAIKSEEGVSVVDREKLSSLTCPMMINGKRAQVKVLATNDCRGKDRDAAGNSKIACKGLDFAVLKEVGGHSRAGAPCLKLSNQVPKYGTSVVSVGHPQKTTRHILNPSEEDSDGQSEYYSPGKTIKYQNYCTPKTAASSSPVSISNSQSAMLRRNVESGNVIQTSGAEAIYEMSGGALIDPKTYELVGVVRSFIKNSPYVECDGSSFHTSTAGILAYMKSQFPDVDLASTFKCSRSAGSHATPSSQPTLRQTDYLGPRSDEPLVTF